MGNGVGGISPTFIFYFLGKMQKWKPLLALKNKNIQGRERDFFWQPPYLFLLFFFSLFCLPFQLKKEAVEQYVVTESRETPGGEEDDFSLFLLRKEKGD